MTQAQQIGSVNRVPTQFYLSESWTSDDLNFFLNNVMIPRILGTSVVFPPHRFGVSIPLNLLQGFFRKVSNPEDQVRLSLLLKKVYFVDRNLVLQSKLPIPPPSGFYPVGVSLKIQLYQSGTPVAGTTFEWNFADATLDPLKSKSQCLSYISLLQQSFGVIVSIPQDSNNPFFSLDLGAGNYLGIKLANSPASPPVYFANEVQTQQYVAFPIFSNFSEFFMFFISKIQPGQPFGDILYLPEGAHSMGVLEITNPSNQINNLIFTQSSLPNLNNVYRFGIDKDMSETFFDTQFVIPVNPIQINLGTFQKSTLQSDLLIYVMFKDANIFDNPLFADYVPQFVGEIVNQDLRKEVVESSF